jgi:hypothetical protein
LRRLLRAAQAFPFPHLVAAALFAAAAAVSIAQAAPWPWAFPENGAPFFDPERVPRSLLALGSAFAAALLVGRRTRTFGCALGFVVVLAAASSTLSDAGRWDRFGPFGRAAAPDAVWEAATAAALALVAARGSWFPARPSKQSPGHAPAVPPWTALVAGGVLLWLAALKIPGLHYFKCPDPWGPANVGMSAAELWTGLLTLLPATRLVGAAGGAALMGGAAVFAWRQSEDGIPWRGCGCFGAVDAPWSVHFVVALVIAVLCEAAFVREAALALAARRDAAPSAPTSFVDGMRARCRPFRAARLPWAPPTAGTLLLVIGAARLLTLTLLHIEAAADGHGGPDTALADILLGVHAVTAGALLLSPDHRRAGAMLGLILAALEVAAGAAPARWWCAVAWNPILGVAAVFACAAALAPWRRDARGRGRSATRLRRAASDAPRATGL